MTPLKLSELTVEQKIGLVLTSRSMEREDDAAFSMELIRKHALDAVRIPARDGNRPMIDRIRKEADYPILIGCDTRIYPRKRGREPIG